MKKSTGRRRRFEVFDIDEDEELVQKQAAMIVKRFPKPVKDDASPVTKYTFLESFASKETVPRRKGTVVVPIESDSSVSRESKSGHKGCIDVYSSGCKSRSVSPHPRESTPLSRPSGCIVAKDIGKNTGQSSFAASISTSTESKSSSEQSMESDVRSWKNDAVNKKVVVSPDSIMYEKLYCTNSVLTFTPNSVELVGCFIDTNKETFSLEWPVTMILKVESQWCQDVETAVINIYIRSVDTATVSENGSSGVRLLKFTVYDPSWFQGEEAIKLLDGKYKALWNIIYDIDSVGEDNELLGTDRSLETENLNEEASKVLVFPKGDHDAVVIGQKDVELLRPETFINDTIVDFYLKYLMTQIPHDERNRFYFFNSFFFRKLADLDKGSNNKSERHEAFQRVRKWTRNVNLFEKDYIFIPVNFSLHWSLIIICYPGDLINNEDNGTDKSSKCTRILHLDSLRGCHRGLKNLFESYLKEELRVRQSGTTEAEVMPLKVSNIQFISLEVPQQQNSFDCGLFLLHYVERFLQLASFNDSTPPSINRDWFPPAEVSCKRSYIQELILKLLVDDSDNRDKDGNINTCFSTASLERGLDQTKSDIRSEETCSSADVSVAKDRTSDEHILISSAEQVDNGATSGFLALEPHENLRNTVSKFCSEVAEKFSDRIALYPNQDKSLSRKANESSTPYSNKLINSLRTSWNTGLSRLQGLKNRRNVSSRGSLSSPVAEVRGDKLDHPTADLIKEISTSKPCSTLVEDLDDCVVQDSEDEAVHDVSRSNTSNKNVPSPSCSEKTNLLDCVAQDTESDDEIEPEPNVYMEKDVIDIEDRSKSYKIIDLSNEADDRDTKPPAKRPRRNMDRK